MRVLVNFVRKQYFMDFCLAELQSLCELQNIKVQLNYGNFNVEEDWVHFIDIPNIEAANIICSRAVLVKNIVKVYSEGKTYDDLLKAGHDNEFKKEEEDLSSFKFSVDAKAKSLEHEEKLKIIDKFHVFDFKGKVNLKKAERTFVILENTVKDYKYFGKIIAGDVNGDPNFYNKFNLNRRTYLGPTSTDNELAFLMANLGQVTKNQYVYDPFVGTGSLIIPPSYLGCHVWGSDIDIRVLKGYGVGYSKKKKKEGNNFNIFTNFIEYGLELPNIIRSDINNSSMRSHEMFDTIICDPPYGHRAFTRKIALDEDIKIRNEKKMKKKEEKKKKELEDQNKIENRIQEENNKCDNTENKEESKEFLNKKIDSKNQDNILINLKVEEEDNDQKNVDDEDDESDVSAENNEKNTGAGQYCVPLYKIEKEKIYENLLQMGKLTLRKGGLLVCLYPFKKTTENKTPTFPKHPDFDLVTKCENPYAEKKSRWCLVYKKKENTINFDSYI